MPKNHTCYFTIYVSQQSSAN